MPQEKTAKAKTDKAERQMLPMTFFRPAHSPEGRRNGLGVHPIVQGADQLVMIGNAWQPTEEVEAYAFTRGVTRVTPDTAREIAKALNAAADKAETLEPQPEIPNPTAALRGLKKSDLYKILQDAGVDITAAVAKVTAEAEKAQAEQAEQDKDNPYPAGSKQAKTYRDLVEAGTDPKEAIKFIDSID